MVKLVNDATAAEKLSNLVINTPCPMDWDRMDGDERRRFCSRCEKHVFNLAEMTEQEVLQLIGDGDRAVCARIFRRPDGTVVTSQCPIPGTKATGRRCQFSIATLVTLLTSSAALFASAPWIGKQIDPIIQRWFPQPPPAPLVAPVGCEMGDVAFVPVNAASTTTTTPQL